jgi:eukaryotic-like serine/threonine-protein kinase
MAQLWVATNEATGAEVCVKILVPQQCDEESVARFRREAYAAARLSHRAIVRIFDLVELGANGETTTSGHPAALAIVMELLHGETLADLLMKKGALPVDEMIDLALPFLSALAHAHRAGVVHRDLKPENVFLSSDPDGHVIPKVLDFGVSKMAGDRGEPTAEPVTLDGVMMGTPSFMSPEQARGSREVDARSDVFSAGILMYMMVAGKNPFASEAFHSVLSAVIHQDPPRLNALPDAIWDVIARSLSKDPEARYADATELGIALKRASGRTSTTDSGPQSGIGITSTPPRAVAVPLGGDSIVTVPPAGDAGDAEGPPARTPDAARRRAVRIVIGVVAAAAVLSIAALLRSPAGSGANASSNAASTAPVVSAPAAITAPVATEAPASSPVAPAEVAIPTAADAGVVKKAAPLPRPPPVKKKENGSGPPKEPSIVRDPGF